MPGMPTSSGNAAWPPNNQNVPGSAMNMQQMQQQQQMQQIQQQQQQQQQSQLQPHPQGMIRGQGQGPMVNMIGQQNPIRIMQLPQGQMQTAGQPVQLRNLLMANQQQQQQQQQQMQQGGDPNVGPPQPWMRQTGPQMMHGQMMLNRAPMPQGPMAGSNHPSGAMIGQMRGGNPMGVMGNIGTAQTAVVSAQAQQQQQQNPDMWN